MNKEVILKVCKNHLACGDVEAQELIDKLNRDVSELTVHDLSAIRGHIAIAYYTSKAEYNKDELEAMLSTLTSFIDRFYNGL